MIDVVISAFNPREKILLCIESLCEHREGVNRIIVIDNNSHDLTNIDKIRDKVDIVIRLDKQNSLADVWNKGVEVSETPYVVISNDDIVFTANWLPPLEKGLDDNPKIGIIQPYNTLSIIPEGFPNNYAHEDRIGDILVSNFIGCCFMIRKSILPELKAFDRKWFEDADEYTYFYSKFYPLWCEDMDVYVRVKKIGYLCQTHFDSYVHHYSGESMYQTDVNADTKSSSDLYFKRWARYESGIQIGE